MQTPRLTSRVIHFGWIGVLVLLLTACHQDMYDQQKCTTYEPSSFFADGRSSRPNVPGAIPFEVIKTDEFLYTGLIDGQEVDAMPFPVTQDLLLRGQLKHNIYCAVCHGESGYGVNMVAERGGIVPANVHQQRSCIRQSSSAVVGGGIVPANVHQQRLREAPSHFFVIIANGVYRGDPENGCYQSMHGYASRITTEDRW